MAFLSPRSSSAARRAALAAAGLLVAVLVLPASPASAGHVDPYGDEACEAGHVPPSPFDDIEGNSHEVAIDCLSSRGVANGITPDRFTPAAPVRRDQMASFLARALTSVRVPLPPGEDKFHDVDGNVHEDNIERLAAAGVVFGTEGCSQDGDRCAYDPNGYVTRAQTATLLVRSYTLTTDYRPGRCWDDQFADDDGLAHEGNINLGALYGLVRGKVPPSDTTCNISERGTYAPHEAVTRDQMASFVARLLHVGVALGPGSVGSPYPRGTSVTLKDGWAMEVIGSDNQATAEVMAENPQNEPPAPDHHFVIVRVRATYTGPKTSTYDGGGRLAARRGDGGSNPDGSPSRVYPSAGRPCGDIPDELQNPAVATGGTVEGNVCFEVPNESTGYAQEPLIVDLRWGHPGLPHFSRYVNQDEPHEQTEASPYVTSAPAEQPTG